MSVDPGRFRGVYALIDPAAHTEPLAYLEALLRGGIRLMQIRAKGGIAPELLRTVVARIRAAGGTAIINDDVDLALEADGVHLGQEDLAGHDLRALRARLGPRAIGLSCGTPGEARAVPAGLVDYLAALLRGGIRLVQIRAKGGIATPLPVAAIGGIALASLPRVRETGATMAAVISALSGAADPEATARAFVTAWNKP